MPVPLKITRPHEQVDLGDPDDRECNYCPTVASDRHGNSRTDPAPGIEIVPIEVRLKQLEISLQVQLVSVV